MVTCAVSDVVETSDTTFEYRCYRIHISPPIGVHCNENSNLLSFSFSQPTRLQWQKVFYISAGMYVLGWITFLLLGTGKQQSWNTPYEDLLVPVDIPREPRKPVMADILSVNRSDPYSINSSDAPLTDTSQSAAEYQG